MRIKTLAFISFIIFSFSCKETSKNPSEKEIIEEDGGKGIIIQDVSKLKYVEYSLDSKTERFIKDWSGYAPVNDLITDIKKGDITFFNDNKKAVQLLLKDLKKSIPKTLNTPSIQARILVFETQTLKLESLANLSTTSKKEYLQIIKEVLISFYTLSYQMNKKIEFDNRTIEKP